MLCILIMLVFSLNVSLLWCVHNLIQMFDLFFKLRQLKRMIPFVGRIRTLLVTPESHLHILNCCIYHFRFFMFIGLLALSFDWRIDVRLIGLSFCLIKQCTTVTFIKAGLSRAIFSINLDFDHRYLYMFPAHRGVPVCMNYLRDDIKHR